MNISKKDLAKSQIELTVELSNDEFKPYIQRGADKVSQEVKIEGFRPGKVPYDILKSKIGEMTILEEAARIAINKTVDQAIKENVKEQIVGQPQINITKLAPENPMEYKVVLSLLPEVKIGEYKNLKVKESKVEVSDKEVEKITGELQEMQAREKLSEAEIKSGDRVIADIEMFLDKVPVEGGQGKGAGVIMGKDYVVPGFDKNILGAKKGDVREFELVFPADHHQKNLAGKKVEFRVKINDVYEREFPKLDDEFAKRFGLNSAEELKSNIKKSIEAEKVQKEGQKCEIEILDKIIKETKFGDIPEVLIDNEAQMMLSELEYSVKSQGGKFEDYLTHINKTKDQLTLDMLPDAVKRVKSSLIIREIARLEKIEVSDHELKHAMDDVLKQYGDSKGIEDKINTPEYKIYLGNMMVSRKVVDKLKEWNLEK